MAVAGSIGSVLVVDDDERVIASLVRSLGFRCAVTTARTSKEAMVVARRVHPDLAIIDLQLGTESGLDVIRSLKAELPATRTALLSGYLSVDTTVAAVRAGADVVMSKPARVAEILRRAEVPPSEPPPALDTPSLDEAISEHIARVLTDCDGNISEAARRLGIARSSLQRKLRKRTPLA